MARARKKGGKEAKADGRPLALIRLVVGMEQKDVAKQAGLSPQKLGRMERGSERAKQEDLGQVASAMGLPPSIFDEAEDFIRFVERMRGRVGVWSGGRWEAPPTMDASSEIAEPGREDWIGAIEDDRLAVSAGRTVKELVFRILRELDGRRP
jgi:transcriptional regulator with XRE-family HTH domain